MPIHAEDLPRAVRDRLGLNVRRSSKKSRAGTGHGANCSGRCGCGEHFDRYSDFEKHAAATGHARWTIDL